MRITFKSGDASRRSMVLSPVGMAVVAGVLTLFACVIVYALVKEPEYARSILVERGYTEIQMHPRRTFQNACGRARGTAPGFTAVNPSGRKVSGVACTSLIFPDVAETPE